MPKKECTGCGACFNVCPKNAISMVEDSMGFKYPIIDQKKCINCGLCKNTCPVIGKPKKEEHLLESYACWSKDETLRFTSTSGGIFTELAKDIIDKKGYVIGAKYNEDNMVVHSVAGSIEELEQLKQSKYLQSDTNIVFRQTKKLLDEGLDVAFCGTPCQIAGLHKYLRRDYSNLLTIEFICRGVNSPKAYRFWLSEIELEEEKKATKVWFKYKINGWKSSPKCTKIDFSDGSSKIYDGKDNLYMRGYLESNLYIRPSCGACKFNGLARQADIVLADFWGIKEEMNDDKGTSLVIINSEKGKKSFENIQERIFYRQLDIEEIGLGNVSLTSSVKINKKSEKFLSSLTEKNFSTLVKKYGHISFRDSKQKLIDTIKKIVKKIIRYKK